MSPSNGFAQDCPRSVLTGSFEFYYARSAQRHDCEKARYRHQLHCTRVALDGGSDAVIRNAFTTLKEPVRKGAVHRVIWEVSATIAMDPALVGFKALGAQ